jgi:hypothetical protein
MVTERPETRHSVETAVCSSKCSSSAPDTPPNVAHVSQQIFRNEDIIEMSVDVMWGQQWLIRSFLHISRYGVCREIQATVRHQSSTGA